MTTRAIYRPTPVRTELHPIAQLVLDELAVPPDPHESDYDALVYVADGYDPLPIDVPAPGHDNWGVGLQAPAQGPAQHGRGWHERR